MHPYPKIKSIARIMLKSKHLDSLNGKAEELCVLKKQIISSIKEPPPCDFTVSDFRQTVLTLTVTQSGYASRLRFMAPDWVQQLRKSDPKFWQYLAQIKIKVCAKSRTMSSNKTPFTPTNRPKSKLPHAQHKVKSPFLADLNEALNQSAHITPHNQPTSRQKSKRLRQLVYGESFGWSNENRSEKKTSRDATTSTIGLAPQPTAKDIDAKLNQSLKRLAKNFS